MHRTHKKLAIFADRGRRGLKLERVYRELYEPEHYLRAYGKIYRNHGAMTPGVDAETADGTSMAGFHEIIRALREGDFRWKPAKRTYIPKSNGKLRPLGLPTWTDKIVQEVIRSILEPYFEARFRDSSHGFRPGQGCHTALSAIARKFRGSTWFIEGDIKGCFDNIDHGVVLGILRESVDDERFIRLLSEMLKAGYLEEWKRLPTLSGTPQGGIISPLLANVYLDKLDEFVEETLFPRYNRGTKRKESRAYGRLTNRIYEARKRGDFETWERLKAEQRRAPSKQFADPEFRRLNYVRYADDFILGFIGPKVEAQEIKDQLRDFLKESLKLDLSPEKTLITHARTEKARFLGHEIGIMHCDHKVASRRPSAGGKVIKQRSINGVVWPGVPRSKVDAKCRDFMRGGKIDARSDQLPNHDFSIVAWYQSVYRGFANYYLMAHDASTKVHKLHRVMSVSLLKTLARRRRISAAEMAKEIKVRLPKDRGGLTVFRVSYTKPCGKVLTAEFGGISLRRRPSVILDDNPAVIFNGRTELLERLLADSCELCGSREDIEVHHIRRLADLKKKSAAQQTKSSQIMIARSRKTLVLCHRCHRKVHNGEA